MAKSYLIEVSHKPGVTDPVGRGLARDISHLGIANVKSVSSAQLYRLEGQLTSNDRRRIGEDLLCDPILQEFREEAYPSPQPSPLKGRGRSGATGEGISVDIWYKQGVTDVVGDSVLKGIRDLDIQGTQSVRTGMRYHLHGIEKKEIAEKIASTLLANPLVHDAIIHAD